MTSDEADSKQTPPDRSHQPPLQEGMRTNWDPPRPQSGLIL
jgi:hypothetical protein